MLCAYGMRSSGEKRKKNGELEELLALREILSVLRSLCDDGSIEWINLRKMITLLEIPPDSDYAIAQSPPTINRFESNLRINSKNWFHLIFICFVFRSSIRVRLLSNFIAQFTLQTFTVYKNTNVVIGVVCSTWHWLNWKRMARANPSYCNKTIHYAHKVLEWNIASVDLCAGALIIRRLALHFHAIRIPFESNASLRARNRKKRMTATATHARVRPHEERSTRNWPNNTYFNNIVCLILELLGVYRL